jgi:hypothetical protein
MKAFLAIFSAALIFWFFCIKAKEQAGCGKQKKEKQNGYCTASRGLP